MARKAARYLLLSQLSLFGFLFLCFLLIPRFLLESNEGGVSNYGLYAKTIVPYTLAFGLSGLLTLQAARYIYNKQLRRALTTIAVLLIAVLVSTYPYKVNHLFNDIHIWAGIILFMAEMMTGIWCGWFVARNTVSLVILAAQFIGFTLATLTYFGLIHVLFMAELLTSLAFSALLIKTVAAVDDGF